MTLRRAPGPVLRREVAISVVCVLGMSLLICSGCRRATPSEVGAADRAGAFPMAEMQASERAAAVGPDVVAASAKGTPMREAGVGGVPPAAVSHSQP